MWVSGGKTPEAYAFLLEFKHVIFTHIIRRIGTWDNGWMAISKS